MPVSGAVLREWRGWAGWDVPETARRLRQAAGASDPLPGHDVLVRTLRRRERNNAGTSERYVLLFARALGIPPARLAGGPPAGQAAPLALPAMSVGPGTGWPGWFGERLAHLITLADTWQHPPQLAALQALLNQEITMSDAAVPPDDRHLAALHELSRRQVLLTIAALPAAALPGARGGQRLSAGAALEVFLARSAASLTACWHLLKGSDLTAAARALSGYLLPLDAAARQVSRHQVPAARLATQAHRICGIIALHRQQLAVRERHCRHALAFASAAADPSAQAAALISLASTYFYAGSPKQAAATYERAFAHDDVLPALQRSRVHAELAVAYGQLGRQQDALRSAGLAAELYPASPDEDPSWLYAEFTPASLTLEQGLAYAALAVHFPGRGYQRQAAGIFAGAADGGPDVPDRIRYEAVSQQAAAAVLLGDLDAFEQFASRGLDGAVRLASGQRHRELQAAWQQATQRWPGSKRLAVVGGTLREAATSCGTA